MLVSLGCALPGTGRAGAADEIVRLVAGTNGLVRTHFVEAGQRVRKGDALVAIELAGADARILTARSNLRDAEVAHESARTNLLALQQRIELGEVVLGLEPARRRVRETETARAEAMAELARIHRQYRTRTLYAPEEGRVTGLPVAEGGVVAADTTVVEFEAGAGP